MSDLVSHASSHRPIAVDLFAGAGGLSLGFEQAGFDVVASLENDPVQAATHLFNFPWSEVLCRDASKISAAAIVAAAKRGFLRLNRTREWPNIIDTVIGGPPCQGFSPGGTRQEDDERNLLLLHFVRLVIEIRPRTFCLENVAGLLEKRFDGIRSRAFEKLHGAGYQLTGFDKPINGLEFGVPQSRRRLVILGSLDHEVELQPLPHGPAPTVGEAFDGLPIVSRYGVLFADDEVELTMRDQELRAKIGNEFARALAGVESVPGDYSRPRLWKPSLLTNSRRTVHSEATLERFGRTAPATVEPKSRFYRLSLSGYARTLRAGTGTERGAHTSPRPIHPIEDRVITVREAARLHGYPDWFRFHTTNWHGHRQVGNSVPPPLGRAAGVALWTSLGLEPTAQSKASPLGNSELLRMAAGRARLYFGAPSEEMPAGRTRKPVVEGRRPISRIQKRGVPAFP